MRILALALTAMLATTAVHARSTSYCAVRSRQPRPHRPQPGSARAVYAGDRLSARRPGYVIDHVKPLCHGGPDDVANMQWQTRAEAKAKDLWECK